MAYLWLVVVGGGGEGSEHPVEGELTVGRDPRADVVVDDSGASRMHARFSSDGDGVTVEDLGSSNGTLVNERPISGAAWLGTGDLVQIGATVFELRPARTAEPLRGAPAPRGAPSPRRGREPAPRAPGRQPDPMEDGNLPALFAAFLGPLSIFLLVVTTGTGFLISLPAGLGAMVLGSAGRRKVDRGQSRRNRGWASFGRTTGMLGAILSGMALLLYAALSYLS